MACMPFLLGFPGHEMYFACMAGIRFRASRLPFAHVAYPVFSVLIFVHFLRFGAMFVIDNLGVARGCLECLQPDGIMPSPEPMLTNHQWILVAFTWQQSYTQEAVKIYPLDNFENYIFKITATYRRTQWIKNRDKYIPLYNNLIIL